MTDAEREAIRREALEEAGVLERLRTLERDRDDLLAQNKALVSAVATLTMEKKDMQKDIDTLMVDKTKTDKYKAWLAGAIVIGALGILFRPAVNLWNLLNDFASRGGQ